MSRRQPDRLLESRNVGMERWPNRRVKYHTGKSRREREHAKLTKPGDDINPYEELITGFCCYMERWVDMINNRGRKRTFVRLWVKPRRGKEGIKDVSSVGALHLQSVRSFVWLVLSFHTLHTNDAEQILPPGSVNLKWHQSIDIIVDNQSTDNYRLLPQFLSSQGRNQTFSTITLTATRSIRQ